MAAVTIEIPDEILMRVDALCRQRRCNRAVFFEDASLRSLNDLDTGAKHAFITLAGRDARVRGDTHINIGNGAKSFSDNSFLVKLALRIFPDSAPDEIGKAFMAGALFAWTVGAA